ncbi:MAG: flagellar hook-basal body complex protein, partial [Aeromonadales bacterium]|nr:flagellar hook-basal body complex protein [Aeromonadales bacterium]
KVGPTAEGVTPAVTENKWQMHVYVDGKDALANPQDIKFDDTGQLDAATITELKNLETEKLGFTNGSKSDQKVKIKVDSATLNSGPFEVTSSSQDGTTVGRLTKVDVGADGLVQATYSNGTTENLGIVAMARFPNDQGLTQIGDTQWRQSLLSGEAVTGQPNTGVFGKLDASALEQSNTDLTSELVDLITAQRNFQANSRALEVNSTLQQTILQIR